jgi:hypothetical protein
LDDEPVAVLVGHGCAVPNSRERVGAFAWVLTWRVFFVTDGDLALYRVRLTNGTMIAIVGSYHGQKSGKEKDGERFLDR